MLAMRGGADLLVATPGRLLELVTGGRVRLDNVRFVVVDEADEMCNPRTFAPDLARLVADFGSGGCIQGTERCLRCGVLLHPCSRFCCSICCCMHQLHSSSIGIAWHTPLVDPQRLAARCFLLSQDS